MIKIDIISGFLGAGKTTLIQKLFDSVLKKEQVVLIENEFGEIGIDGGFLKESGIKMKEINSGCICCSLVGDFQNSMAEVITKFNPDRIIIEPSGVGKLSDIINAVKKLKYDYKLNILATVVDGRKAKSQMKNFGEFFNNQIEACDTIIISKTELIDESKVTELVGLLKEKNPKATIITTPVAMLEADQLVEILEENVGNLESMRQELVEEHEHHHDEECSCGCHDHEHHHEHDEECHCHDHEHEHEHEHHHDGECTCGCHDHHHHHHADEVFTSWGIETVSAISKKELTDFLDKLANDATLGLILRAKGILRASDQDDWYYFDFVAGDYEIRNGKPDYTGRLCVIGSKIDTEKIENLFNNR